MAVSTYKQITVRAYLCITILSGLMAAIIAAADTSAWKGIVLIGIAARLVAILIVGGGLGWYTGTIMTTLIATFCGVLLADLVWWGFIFTAFSVGTEDAVELVSNPLIAVALITCPAAAAKSRIQTLIIGVSLSWVLPVIGATAILISCYRSPAPGTGLLQALTVIVAMMAVVVGIAASIAARSVVEFGRYLRNRKPGTERQL